MKKFLVFIADGSEEVEVITVVDYLRRAGIEVDLVSVMEKREIVGAHGIKIEADKLLSDIDSAIYDGVYSPGGLPGAYNIRDREEVLEIYRSLDKDGKIVSALCAAPTVLDRAGLLKDRNFTCYPGFEENIEDGNLLDKNIVVDGNLVTGKGPALAAEISYALIEMLLGTEKRREIEEDTLYNLI